MKVLTYQSSFKIDAVYQVWKNAGWEVQPPPPPKAAPSAAKTRASALKGKSGFFAFPNLQPMGWEVQPPPPPHLKPEKAGSIQVGDSGNQDILRNFNPQGWEIQPSLLPHPRTEKSASYLRGDDGVSFTYINWLLSGWEVQPPHLQHPRPEKSAWLIGEDGIEAPYIFTATTPVRDFGFSNAFNLRIPVAQRGAGLKGKSGFFAFPDLLKFGWEIQSVQPNHLRTEKAGSIQVGSGGVDAPYVFVPPPQPVDFGFSINVPLKLMSLVQRGAGAGGRSEFASFSWTQWGFDDRQLQPLHPHFERAGQFVIGSGGVESPFTPPPPPPPIGYEMIPVTWPLRTWQRGAGLKGKSGFFAFPDLLKFGWEIQSYQPNHPRVERAGATQIGEDGIEFPFIFVPTVQFLAGYDVPPSITRRVPRIITSWDDGTADILRRFFSFGFDIQSWQPPHRAPESKYAAFVLGDAGTQARQIIWLNVGWEVQPVQPGHPRPEKSSAWMIGEDGTEFPFIPPMPPPPVTEHHDMPFFASMGQLKSW